MEPENSDRSKILLYHWVRIIKRFSPHKRTENPYWQETQTLSEHLSLEDKLLFHDLLHSITLINAQSRQNDQKQLISTQADFINALQLIQPQTQRSNLKTLNTHEKLRSIFQEKAFTYLDACTRLRTSKSTIKRTFKSLLVQGLLIKLDRTQEKKTLFQAIPIKQVIQEPIQSMFETMQGDWKDFIGFVEF